MRISVAMATYNGQRFLLEQLRSIAAQTRPPAELVVSDDGSDDATLAIIDAFAREAPFPVRVLPAHERLGFADNFLHAAAACRFDLVALADQDDVWLPHKLGTAHDRLLADDSLLAMHRLTLVDETLAPIGEQHQGIVADACYAPLDLDPYVTGWGNTMLFRRELATLVPRGDRPRQPQATRPLSHDTWLYVLAAALGRVSHIREPLILYRQHAANVWGTTVHSGQMERLRRTLENLRTVPLTIHRERATFDTHMVPVFDALAKRSATVDQAAAAARAAARFAERAARRARRVHLYEADTLRDRAKAFVDIVRTRPMSAEGVQARRKNMAKDALLGVAGLGRRS